MKRAACTLSGMPTKAGNTLQERFAESAVSASEPGYAAAPGLRLTPPAPQHSMLGVGVSEFADYIEVQSMLPGRVGRLPRLN